MTVSVSHTRTHTHTHPRTQARTQDAHDCAFQRPQRHIVIPAARDNYVHVGDEVQAEQGLVRGAPVCVLQGTRGGQGGARHCKAARRAGCWRAAAAAG